MDIEAAADRYLALVNAYTAVMCDNIAAFESADLAQMKTGYAAQARRAEKPPIGSLKSMFPPSSMSPTCAVANCAWEPRDAGVGPPSLYERYVAPSD